MALSIRTALKAAAFGAACMYYFDPDRGRRRRAGVVDRGTHLLHGLDQLWQKGCRDLSNRSTGLVSETKRLVAASSARPADDRLLVERVRSTLGHHVDDARQIVVAVHNGTVTLDGKVHAGEPERLIPALQRVPGVKTIQSSLVTTGEPIEPSARHLEQTPAARLLMTAGGGLLMANALVRRGFTPALLGTLGFGLFVHGLATHPGQSAGRKADPGSTDRKSLQIHTRRQGGAAGNRHG